MPVGPWDELDVCSVCPAQVLRAGEFDVTERPGPASRYDAGFGYRVDGALGVAVCVHPFRVGMPPGGYASAGVPAPVPVLDAGTAPAPPADALDPPEDVRDVEAWLIATLRLAGPGGMSEALDQAQDIALARYPEDVVLDALRRALSGRELARPRRQPQVPASWTMWGGGGR